MSETKPASPLPVPTSAEPTELCTIAIQVDAVKPHRRSATVFRSERNVYEAQLKHRESIADPMWLATVRDIIQLHTLNLLLRAQRRCDSIMFVFACWSVLLEAISIEVYWTYMNEPWCESVIELARAMISTLTGAMLCILYRRYGLAASVEVESNRLPANAKFYHPSSRLLWSYLFECFVVLLHIPPGIDFTFSIKEYVTANVDIENPAQVCLDNLQYIYSDGYCYRSIEYSINHTLGIIVVLRIYLIGRFLRNLQGFYTNDVKLIGSMYNVDATSAWLSQKYIFRFNPGTFTSSLLFFVWIITALAVDESERSPANTEIGSYLDSLWFTIVTMTTVGFGDSTVQGLPGRAVVVLGGVVGGAVISALCRVVVVGILSISASEADVILTIGERRQQSSRREIAAKLIQTEWRRCQQTTQLDKHAFLLQKHKLMAKARVNRLVHTRGAKHPADILSRWTLSVTSKSTFEVEAKHHPVLVDMCFLAEKLEQVQKIVSTNQ